MPEAFCSLLKTLYIISVSAVGGSKQNHFLEFLLFPWSNRAPDCAANKEVRCSSFLSPGKEREHYWSLHGASSLLINVSVV